MENVIYSRSAFGATVTVTNSKIEHKVMGNPPVTIFLRNVSSVTASRWTNMLVINTNSGRTFEWRVSKAAEVAAAINQALAEQG